ncbi:MAG: hypothetical protein EOP84_32750 [Verrucomicrobiaceae bacterium]|nr:MAG: hypothetical protein EOP84_32750 [Verrucomicrobiaceae bacterium]
MERIDQRTVAHALLTAPGWARIGITHPKPSLRQEAADELARHILESVSDDVEDLRSDQSVLPL